MKTIETILSHLRKEPYFRPLRQHFCYEQYLSMLPPRFKDAIGFIYIKESTLHIALRHPGYKMELELNKDLLLDLLNSLGQNDTNCKDIEAKKVVLFNSKYLSIEHIGADDSTVPHYTELAEGEFTDQSHDPALQDEFDKIRNNIIDNLKNG